MEHRVSISQVNALLDILLENPWLVGGVSLGTRSKEATDRKWQEIADILNHGSGSSKSAHRWKRYWIDLKHRVKGRAAQRRTDAVSTGGGTLTHDEDLTEVEQKVLAIIGKTIQTAPSSQQLLHTVEDVIIETIQSPCLKDSPNNGVVRYVVCEKLSPEPTPSTSTGHVEPLSEMRTETIQIPCLEDSPNNGVVRYVKCEKLSPETTPSTSTGHVEPLSEMRTETIQSHCLEDPPNNGVFRYIVCEKSSPEPTPSTSTGHVEPLSEMRTGSETATECPRAKKRLHSSPLRSHKLRNQQKVDNQWVIELEQRRVDAEQKMAEAATTIANAASLMADACKMQAEASLRQTSIMETLISHIIESSKK